MGGTRIAEPLAWAQTMTNLSGTSEKQKLYEQNLQRRIFILTDGAVENPQEVIEQAGKVKDQARIHTFGVGDNCDKKMVADIAKAGRGSCSILRDNSSVLNGHVIEALNNAYEPSLKGCKLHWNG